MNAVLLFALALAGVAFFALVGAGFIYIALSPRQGEQDEPTPDLRRVISLTPRELGRAPCFCLGLALLALAVIVLITCLTL